VARVRNEGIARARARWIAFLDSDDLWKPEKLERQMAALARSGAAWSFTGLEVIEPTGAIRRLPAHAEPARTADDLLLGLVEDRWSAPIISVVVDRDALAAIGGFSESADLELREDLDLVFRLAERSPAVHLPEILVSGRDHPERATRALDDAFLRSANVFRALLGRDPPRPVRRAARRVLARHLTASARIDLSRGDRWSAWAKLRECAWPGAAHARWWWLSARAVVTG
jgi:glycosyltransferase involved in cell wall biosynthesis